jgi:hypothetical protein
MEKAGSFAIPRGHVIVLTLHFMHHCSAGETMFQPENDPPDGSTTARYAGAAEEQFLQILLQGTLNCVSAPITLLVAARRTF